MAGVLALDIDTSAGETVTLKADGGDVVFSISGGTDYKVEVSNSTTDMTPRSHFHVYYDQIFTGVAKDDQFDFDNQEGVKHPGQCPEALVVGIFPVRCGGLCITAGGDPLS